MSRILFAEDDKELHGVVEEWLAFMNFRVDIANDGLEAKGLIQKHLYDLLILDWSMPGLSGLDVCIWHRLSDGTIPILMLTGRGDIEDKLAGFKAGVDDYLTKPFDVRELSSRVKALMRRNSGPDRSVVAGPLKLNSEKYRAEIDGSDLKLTPTEFALLACLCSEPRRVFSANSLLKRVWDRSGEATTTAVRIYVKRLRDKLALAGHPELIENVHGVGYKFVS